MAFDSNDLGKFIAIVGGLLLVSSVFSGLENGFHLFDKYYLVAIGMGISLLLLGLYIRIVGRFLKIFGKALILFSILHGILLHWVDLKFLAFGFDCFPSAHLAHIEVFC